MLMAPIVEGLQADLESTAALGGDDVRRAATVLVAALGPAIRLRVLDALEQAAEELTQSFPGATVELKLSGRDPVLSLSLGANGPPQSPEEMAGGGASEDEIARITLRLPETLKARIERLASREGVSVNTWLVSAAYQALRLPPATPRSGRRITGFVRG